MQTQIKELAAKIRQQNDLMNELEQISKLRALGIKREDIKYQRKQTNYWEGCLYPNGYADVILKDGTQHVVPDSLLIWSD